VLRGLGIAFMTRAGLETELEAERLAHVPLRQGRSSVHSELGLYARAETTLPAAAAAFAEQLTQVMEHMALPGDKQDAGLHAA
jgi:DNA-binding transcriptional LysR family regulator